MKAYKIFFNKKSKKIEVSEFENILSSDLHENLIKESKEFLEILKEG